MTTHIHEESPDSEEYSFIHELGHVLHFALTDSLSIAPEGFTQIQKIMLNEKGIPAINENVCELLADCFAMAATLGPPLEKYNSYEMLSGKDKSLSPHI